MDGEDIKKIIEAIISVFLVGGGSIAFYKSKNGNNIDNNQSIQGGNGNIQTGRDVTINIKEYIIWVKKHKVFTSIILIILLLFPLVVIHLLFKWDSSNEFFHAEWSAGDLIGYIAGFEAFVGTVVLGIVSVWQTDRANKTNYNLLELTKENERKSVLPFLSFNLYLEKDSNCDIFSSILEFNNEKKYTSTKNDQQRIEFLITELYFTINNKEIKIDTDLNPIQNKKVNEPLNIEMNGSEGRVRRKDHSFLKIHVKNCGKGAAINLECRVYKQDCDGEEFDANSIPFTLSVETHFNLGLYFDCIDEVKGKYNIELIYYDIYMNKYTQTIYITAIEKPFFINLHQPQVKE